MKLSEDMREAENADEMADAFHPSMFGLAAHRSTILEGVEAALLFASGRISRDDFLTWVEEECES
jgi:hypothetical protein